IEDAAKAHQHPKLEQYGEGIFIVARTAQLVEGRIAFGETHMFVGRGYVVTVRHGPRLPMPPYERAASPAPRCWPTASITFYTPSSTSSSITTRRWCTPCTRRWRSSRTAS